jgi:hypothetical protein
MPDPAKQWFHIYKHQFGQPGTEVVDTVRGLGLAEHRVAVLDRQLAPEEKAAAWGHFLGKGTRPAGLDRRRRRQPPDRSPRRRR